MIRCCGGSRIVDIGSDEEDEAIEETSRFHGIEGTVEAEDVVSLPGQQSPEEEPSGGLQPHLQRYGAHGFSSKFIIEVNEEIEAKVPSKVLGFELGVLTHEFSGCVKEDVPSVNHPSSLEPNAPDYYSDSYSHLAIHEEMLKDSVRTGSYLAAMVDNQHLFRGRVVLDIGCGTGILSMFAARAGAARVIGVEMSSMAELARHVVVENGLERVITIVQGKLEDVELPGGLEEVDIIISEWMGYCLFSESMLDSVIFARDKWLVPSGLLFPDRCSLYICGAETLATRTERLDFWEDIWGFRMPSMRKFSMETAAVEMVTGEAVVTNSCLLKEVNMYTWRKEDSTFSSVFHLEVARKDYVTALVTYFDVEFSHCRPSLGFSTSPWESRTHWRQTVFHLGEYCTVLEGEAVAGTFRMWPNQRNRRDVDCQLEVLHWGRVEDSRALYRYSLP